jgi:CoA:oxalate CoA-transferase
VEHRGHVVGVLSEIFRQNTVDHWLALCETNDIPACRVNRLEDALHSEQIKVNGLVVERDDPKRGKISILGPPVHLSRTKTAFERLAPMIGEHTDEVLREFGLGDDEIASLHASKVV